MNRLMQAVAVLLLLTFGYGCAIYSAAVDERNVKTIANDTKIKTTIVKRFIEDDTVKSLDVSAFSYDGHVYLTGEYDSPAQKERAVAIARQVDEVKSVTAYLLPKRKADLCGLSDNISLAAKVKTRLIKDKEIWSTNINVESVQCNIVLLGIVGSRAQVTRAVEHARSVEGVRSVQSYLRVGR